MFVAVHTLIGDNADVEAFARSMAEEASVGNIVEILNNRGDTPEGRTAPDMGSIRNVVAVVIGEVDSAVPLPFQALAGTAGVVAATHSLDPRADIARDTRLGEDSSKFFRKGAGLHPFF